MAGQHLDASIVGEERGVDVNDLLRERVKKLRGENQHPASQDDQIGIEGMKHLSQPAVICLAHDRVVAIGQWQRYGGHPSGRRSPQRTGSGAIADDDHYLGVERAARDGIEQCLQVRSRARGENRDPPQGQGQGHVLLEVQPQAQIQAGWDTKERATSRRACMPSKWMMSTAA